MKIPKSFRLSPTDLKKLEKVDRYYKNNYDARVESGNMDNLHDWTPAQTVSVMIRDKFEEFYGRKELNEQEEKEVQRMIQEIEENKKKRSSK
ncbi:hypothetical protein [Halobacillus karajensis]|uniref:hypothetical protein n=1 Tax=Halobacillus karajensis TaxID=195088 RepID=UPI00045D0A1F|nr:hypothetical protein [Halobacillus karajensis]CDQ21731.1 hypothetical protein BN982_04140 [Halobacillus karajensis]